MLQKFGKQVIQPKYLLINKLPKQYLIRLYQKDQRPLLFLAFALQLVQAFPLPLPLWIQWLQK